MSTTPFRPDDIVHAADQNNFGHVIEDNGGQQVHVRFRNPETGQEAEPWLDRSLLTLASGQARSGSLDEGIAGSTCEVMRLEGNKSVVGRLNFSSFDAWALGRLLSIEAGLNGDLANLSAHYRNIAVYLGTLPLTDRQAAWQGFLCSVPDPHAIVQAIANASPTDPSPPLETVRRPANAADLKTAIEGIKWAWELWIPFGRVSGIAAFEGTGKTRLAMDFARRAYFELPAPDGRPMNIPAGSPSLWICADCHQDELAETARAMGIPLEAILFNTVPEDPYGGTSLDDPEAIASLDEFVGMSGAKLVFVDTLTNATHRDLCRQNEIGPLLAPLQQIAQRHEIAVVLLQHVSREGQALGRRSKGLTRTLIHLACPDTDQPTRLRLWVEKSFVIRPPALGVTMTESGNTYDTEPPVKAKSASPGRPPEKTKKAISFLEEKLAQGDRKCCELVDEWLAMGESKSPFFSAKDRLIEAGRLVVDDSRKPQILHWVQASSQVGNSPEMDFGPFQT
jgi:hypothetical protein